MTPKILKFIREVAIFIFVIWVASTAISYFRAPKLDSDTLPHIEGKLIDGTLFDSNKLRFTEVGYTTTAGMIARLKMAK